MLFCDLFCTSCSKLLQPGRHSRTILRSYGCCRKQLYYFQACIFSPRVQRFKDLFWSAWQVTCVSQWYQTCFSHFSNIFWELSASGACISGNVHYWCSRVWRLLTGMSRNGIWHILRQTVPSIERSVHDGKRCSRNYGEIFLSSFLMLISKQCFGPHWKSFCTSFICILITNMVLTCVFLSFLYSYSLLQSNSSAGKLPLF